MTPTRPDTGPRHTAGAELVNDPDCPHDAESGDEGPISELGRWPVRWRCDSCGRIRHDKAQP